MDYDQDAIRKAKSSITGASGPGPFTTTRGEPTRYATVLDHCLPSKRLSAAIRASIEPENKDYAAKSAALATVSFNRSASEPAKGPKNSKQTIEVLDEDQDMEPEVEVSLFSLTYLVWAR